MFNISSFNEIFDSSQYWTVSDTKQPTKAFNSYSSNVADALKPTIPLIIIGVLAYLVLKE